MATENQIKLSIAEIQKRLRDAGLYDGSIRNARKTSISYGDFSAYAVETGWDSFYCYFNEKTGEITRERPKR